MVQLLKTPPPARAIPSFIYGTAWKEERTEACVRDAIRAGFRAIDTANQRKHYFEAAVGLALKAEYATGTLSRSDFFLQTKFTSIGGQDQRLPYDADAPATTQVEQSFASSLEHLGTDYLDSYVLHGPTSGHGLNSVDWEIWGAMEALHHAGKAKALGVSNVNLEQLRALCERARVKPLFVQNRCYARLGWDKSIRAFCNDHQITYQGFSLLTANSALLSNKTFSDVVHRLKCTPAQAIFRFAQSMGILPLTGTTDPLHMSEDLRSVDIAMTQDEARAIETCLL